MKRNNRREVFVRRLELKADSVLLLLWDTVTEEGCQCSRWDGEEKGGGGRAPSRDQRWRVQKAENKEGINETHQRGGAIAADENVSKILEASALSVFNLLSGHADISPSSHYQALLCKWDNAAAELIFSCFINFSFTDLGRNLSRTIKRWLQKLIKQEYTVFWIDGAGFIPWYIFIVSLRFKSTQLKICGHVDDERCQLLTFSRGPYSPQGRHYSLPPSCSFASFSFRPSLLSALGGLP